MWGAVMQLQVANKDALLQLQVHSSTSAYSTLEWFNTNNLAQSSSANSKPAHISDPCLGQVSILISDLQQAVQEAEQYQQQRQQFYSPHSPGSAAADVASADNYVLQLRLPLYGPVAGQDSTAGKHAAASRSQGLAMPAAQDSLADFVADTMQCSAVAGTAASIARTKVALPGTSTHQIEQQCQQSIAVFNPCTGRSSCTQGRAEVGELFVDASISVEQLLQPQDAAAAALAADVPVKALLEALDTQGQQVHLPQPLARAAAVVEAYSICSTHPPSKPAEEDAPPSGSAAGAAAAAELDAAVSLMSAVWRLWQLGTLADTAAAYQAAITATEGVASRATAADDAAKGVPKGQRLHMRATADHVASSQECSWTLPAVHAYGNASSPAVHENSKLLQLQQHTDAGAHPGSKAGGRRSITACVLVSSSASSSACSSTCTSMTGSEAFSSADGSGELLYTSRYQNRQQQQQPSRLQQSTGVSALEACNGGSSGSSSSSSSSTGPAWEQVLQLQQQAAVLHTQGKQAQHGPSPAAEAVLQLLSCRRLLSRAASSCAATSEGSSSTVLPGMYYMQVLSDAAVIGGLRPAAVRLALLQQLLLSWQPDQSNLQALLDLSLPLLVADRQRLLTTAEAAALHDAAGSLMDALQHLISCHYDIYTSVEDATACLPLLLALLAALMGSTIQQQLAAAASPLLAAAAQHRFVQALDPQAKIAAAAVVANLTAKLAGAAAAAVASNSCADPECTAAGGTSDAPVQAEAAPVVPAAGEASASPPGIFDMLKFRDALPWHGTASSSGGTTAAPNSSGGRPPGVFGNFLDKMHQLRQQKEAGSQQCAAQESGNPWWRLGKQSTEATEGQPPQQQQLSAAAGMKRFWGPAGPATQHPAQQLNRCAAGPVAEGVLRTAPAAAPLLGSPMWRAKSRHGRVGSCGVLDMWQSHDAELQPQQQHCKDSSNSGAGGGVLGGSGLASNSGALCGAAQAAAAISSSACAIAACCAAQDGSWQQDARRTADAARVVLEELERDVQLQAGLPQQLQLPLIGLHVRYSLLHSHVKSLLTCGHELVYDAATRGLEAAVRQLHDQLLQQGWAALPVEGSKERLGTGAVLPERGAAGNLPRVTLCDLDSLMAPVWANWLRSSGQHLTSVVDSLIAVQAQAPAAPAAAALGNSSNGSFNAAAGSRPGSWAPVAPSQGAHYSASVVDLFVHLQVLVDQVMDVAVKPVRSYSRRAATARQLFGITTAAVEQYAAHLHAAATGLLRVSQVVMAPSSVVQSGKTARHKRGESSPATSRQGSIIAAPARHGRTHSALPAGLLGGMASAGPTGSSSNPGSSSNAISSATPATASLLDCQAAAGDLDLLQASSMSAVWGQPLVSPEVCVVLSSLQELLSQQQRLDEQICEELGPPPAVASTRTSGTSYEGSGCAQGSCRAGAECSVDKVTAPGSVAACVESVDRRHGCLLRSNALPHGISSNGRTEEVHNADDSSSSSSSGGEDDADDAGDSDVSEMLLTEDEEPADTDLGPAEAQPQPSLLARSSSQSSGTATADEAAAELDVTVSNRQQNQQQQQPLQASDELHAATYADIKQKSAESSRAISSLMQQLLLAVTEQLQGHSIALLASLLSVCRPQVAAAAAATASAAAVSKSTTSSAAIADAAAKHAATEQLASPGAQLVLGPLLAEMASLERSCCPAVKRQLVMAYWNALLAAVVKVALCQAGSSVHGRHGSWLLLPHLLQMHHAVLLQQLLAVVQTQVSEMMLGGQQHNAAAALAPSTVAGIAAAAVHARSVLQMVVLPTAQLTQRFVQVQNTAQPIQQPTQLDIMRCLQQRACDLEAQLFVQQQLHNAGGSIMQLLFGLPASEAVQVYAACSTTAGSAGGIGAGNKPVLAALGSSSSSSSSSSSVPGAVAGCIYLSASYLAFTDLLTGCDSTSSSTDADAIAKRVAKAVKQAQAGAMKAGQPATMLPPPPASTAAAANPAAAGATGSNSSSGLATKSWWKSSLLPSSGGSSSGSSSGSSAVPAAGQPHSSTSAPASVSSSSAAAAAALAADTTLLVPLADVARLDKVYHKGQEALALTMQTDRSLRVFYGFECAAVRDKLHDAVRLAVMGSNTALDRNLRCCEETVAALDLGLPHNERVIRVHPCFKYGTVRNKPGNLYLCSSMFAFDYDDSEAPKAIAVQQQLQGTAAGPGTALAGVTGRVHSSQLLPAAAAGDTGESQTGDVLLGVGSRVLVRYADILKLKQEKGSWGDKHWLVVVYASGPRSEPCTLELGGGGQQLVSDMLADLSRIMAATGH
uniref:Uncharacterized protein n=1 Tax=Tetradesmus obliquus TaxID=3088 RepID=A0A383V8Q0_TETOB|eukprot:jgi/Sobl393_1/3356/SZX61947.1